MQDTVEPLSGDELHGVVMDTVAFAGTEDRDDVGMVQSTGRPCLALKPPQVAGAAQRPAREDLEGNVPAQRFLDGLVDDAHAATAQFAEQAILAEVTRAISRGLVHVAEWGGPVAGRRLELL